MKKYFFKTISTLFLLTLLARFALAASLVAPAESSNMTDLCPDQLAAFENVQVQQSLLGNGTECFLSLHPRNSFESLVYRDYLITSSGLLMVFNSYSADLSSASDGAREFYLFPKEFKGFQWKVEDQYLVVTGFADRVLKFSLKTAQLEVISGAEVKLADKVLPNNKGGLEILSADFLYVDAGFKLGDSPSYDHSRNSEVKNPQKQVCSVKNPKIYNYDDDDVTLKPLSEVKVVVKATCPGFVLEDESAEPVPVTP